MYVPFAKIKKHYGVSSGTFQRWANEGKIDSTRTPRKHRLFKLPDATSSEKNGKGLGRCRRRRRRLHPSVFGQTKGRFRKEAHLNARSATGKQSRQRNREQHQSETSRNALPFGRRSRPNHGRSRGCHLGHVVETLYRYLGMDVASTCLQGHRLAIRRPIA